MLDFDRRVERDLGKFAVQRFNQWDGVADAVEKIGIAESDVLRAGRDLAADIFEDEFQGGTMRKAPL